jgi:hypothetical protein
LYFVKPTEEDYLEKRENFAQLKDVNQFVLNIGFQVNKKKYKELYVFMLGSVGPLISETETDRLSKGLAFSDCFALGLSLNFNKIRCEVGGILRHESNAGLKNSISGFNTKNFELGFSYEL